MKLYLPVRKATLTFYLALTFLFIIVIMMIIQVHSKVPEYHVGGNALFDIAVILDAGHGGQDGGAVSNNGVLEAPITLKISQKAQTIFRFCGISAVMTRENENSLGYDASASVRDNKNKDLKERLKIAEQYPGSVFISVHLNKFSQAKSCGAQTFYGIRHPNSKLLADIIQEKLVALLDPQNTRVAKRIPGTVYLMEYVENPAVTVECGFLSNPNEEILLQSDAYQTKLAISIMAGYFEYRKGS